jgi:hypothetical protein
MEALRRKAIGYGASEFGKSKVKGKRYYVVYQNRKINFGSDVGSTFIDHGDLVKRKAWYARHSKIQNKNGEYVINLKTSPDYWAAKILW